SAESGHRGPAQRSRHPGHRPRRRGAVPPRRGESRPVTTNTAARPTSDVPSRPTPHVPSRPTPLFHPDHSALDEYAMTPESRAGEALELPNAVAGQLRGHSRVGVAYSVGVDSATLLALAVRALGGENVVALLGVSPSLARRERRLAHRVA